jgi:hypothetical protein
VRNENEIRHLLERARGGDATELASLREALDQYPKTWRAYGDLAAHARNVWISLIAGMDLALKESLGHKVEEMKAELAGPDPSPLEVLLVERIVACWLQVGYADAAAAQAGEMSIQQGNYIRHRQDSAHRRYLSAIATLAMTRRLLGLATSASSRGSGTKSRTSGPVRVVGAETIECGHDELGGHLPESGSGDGDSLEFGLRHGRPSVSVRGGAGAFGAPGTSIMPGQVVSSPPGGPIPRSRARRF